jgi:sugar-specific transcriptional regulator TrmB
MSHENRAELVELGLSTTEAQVYLSLLQNPALSASAIAAGTDLSRSRVYQTLCSLADKGLVESGAGYGSKFAVVEPAQAFPALIARERESLAQREELAGRVGQRLSELAQPGESAPDDSVQVIRTPQLIGEKLHRLQLEATRLNEGIIKAPIMVPRPSNPAQLKAMERGVHYKALYERAVLQDPKIAPYIDGWIAGGEEARVFDGELPYKFVVFDQEVVLSTIVSRSGPPTALLVRHPPYARSMSILFNFFWNQSKPLFIKDKKAGSKASETSAKSAPKTDQASQRISRNGRRSRHAKV